MNSSNSGAKSHNIDCFICNGNHFNARDSPMKQSIQAMQQNESKGSSVQGMGTIQLLNAMKEAVQEKCSRLLYVTAIINGRPTRVMVDSGATHNFMTPKRAKELVIKLEEDTTTLLKAVNSAATKVPKVARNVTVRVGDVPSKTSFSVVNMDVTMKSFLGKPS